MRALLILALGCALTGCGAVSDEAQRRWRFLYERDIAACQTATLEAMDEREKARLDLIEARDYIGDLEQEVADLREQLEAAEWRP